MIGELTEVLHFLLIIIILDFDKNFVTICPRRMCHRFSPELLAVKYNFTVMFQIFAFNGLGDTSCFYIVPPTILISVIYFSFIIYQGIL